MTKAKRLILTAAAATVGLVTTTTLVSTASAETNRRVCGQIYTATVRPGGSSGPQYNYVGAFMGKVSKDDTAACQAVLNKAGAMDPKDLSSDKSIPWIKGDNFDPTEMTPCEELIDMFGPPDPCLDIPVSSAPNDVKIVNFILQTTS